MGVGGRSVSVGSSGRGVFVGGRGVSVDGMGLEVRAYVGVAVGVWVTAGVGLRDAKMIGSHNEREKNRRSDRTISTTPTPPTFLTSSYRVAANFSHFFLASASATLAASLTPEVTGTTLASRA